MAKKKAQKKVSEIETHENIYVHIKKRTIKTFFTGLLYFGLNSILTFFIVSLVFLLESVGDVDEFMMAIGYVILPILILALLLINAIIYMVSGSAILLPFNKELQNVMLNDEK